GQHQRAVLPGFTRELVLPFVHHARGVDVAAVDAERVRVDKYLRPAMQAFGAELDKREATERGEGRALQVVEREAGKRGDGLVAQEARAERTQARGAVVVECGDPGH